MVKSNRQIIEELFSEYIRLRALDANLEQMGISVPAFKFDTLNDWALDLIGFPIDTTATIDSWSEPDCFCRDYLLDPLYEIDSATDVSRLVSEYVDWLYAKYHEHLDEERQKKP